MANDKQSRPISVEKELKYTENYNLYTVQMVHRRFPWWLLLLLLPLLLLIQCHKDIEVRCIEPQTNAPIEGQQVTMEYESHFLWNKGRFLACDSIKLTQTTDSTGTTVFQNLPCSVYSYIFYCLSKASFSAKSECHAAIDVLHNFHYTRHVELAMEPRREDLHIKLLDLETKDPLPDGMLIYKYVELGDERTDSAKADAAGAVTIPQMRYCSIMKLLHGRCYGYADTSKVDVPCKNLILADDSAALLLRPIKKRFTFFVKNIETKQPIPDAQCAVTLTHPSGKTDGPHYIRTSIDGKGIAVYGESFILSVINIKAHKVHYKDSILTGGPWTVEEFIKQPDSIRTIWLTPLPYTQEFINIDSINGKPIPGVKNIITVTDPDGTVHNYEEISNRNGVFPVEAKEDSKVEIISIKDPDYKKKNTKIPVFKDVKDKKIPLSPYMVKLIFRTVNATKPGTLVPNCNLRINGSISGTISLPTNSNNGIFDVEFRRAELLTIVASRNNWITTTNKVSSKNYDYLKVDQERRDIPLKQNLPPCNAGKNTPKGANEMHHSRSYGMGIEEGNASIWVDFYGEPDHLKIIDGEGNVVLDRMVKNKNEGGQNPIPFHFKGGSVTVIIDTSTQNGSSWEYILNCPHQ